MIDILISLCLVFALFSGLVSGINELIAQMLEMRGKVLYESIALLLGELPSNVEFNAFSMWKRWGEKIKFWLGRVEGSVYTVKLFAHPLIDTLSQPGSKPSYIAPSSFAAALVQVLSNDGSWSALRQSLDDRSQPLGKLFGPMLDQANGDIGKFKTQVESHFTLVMDRVGGWYKRRSQAVMFVVAFVLAMGLNVDTIFIAQNLQNNPELVAQLVKRAETPNSTDAPTETPSAEAQIEALKSELNDLQGQITDFQQMGLPIGWHSLKHELQNESISFSDRFCTALKDSTKAHDGLLMMMIGWIFTALAATLGAPFWFDSISKLFAIRGAGRKSEDASTASGTPATPAVQVIVPPATLPLQLDSSPLNDYEATRLNGEDIEGLQRALDLPGVQINGQFSPELRAALRKWQGLTGRVVNGQFDEPTVLAILYPES